MKKWLKSLSKEQIQRYVFVGLLVVVFVAFFISLSIATNNEKNNANDDPIENPGNNNSGSNGNNNSDKPDNGVIEKPDNTPTVEKLGMPISGAFEVVRKFYDPEDTSQDQELAVIKFGKRYYTSNGIGIVSETKEDFNVVAALSGEVVSVDESTIYGIVVTIKHEESLYTEYGSLSKTNVKVGQDVKQGEVIGVSGVCEYDSELSSHVFFKVLSGTKTYNPEDVIGKTIKEVMK